jgi:membrane-associated phospholipid phosphatase
MWSGQFTPSSLITNFADQAVVLPLSAVILLVFAFMQWWRGAIAWSAVVGSAFALILLFKLRFFACDQVLPGALVRNPSGHTAAAAVVYGGLAITIVRSKWTMDRSLIPIAAAISALIAVVIGASRIRLDKHSMLEVLIGASIGIAGAVSFALLAGPPKGNPRFRRRLLLVVLVIAVFYGVQMPVEHRLESVGKDVRQLLSAADINICR